MKSIKYIKFSLLIAILALGLTACSNVVSDAKEDEEVKEVIDHNDETTEQENLEETGTIKITDAHGSVVVPINPKNVVSLDNRTFETLSDWGIELAAVPKPIMPTYLSYVSDESVQDIGNHREPNLEIIAAVDPELVIIGQRFASYYDDIKALVPNAAVIDLNFDVSEETNTPGENLISGLKSSTHTLGQIFDKNEEAEQLTADFDKAIEEAKSAYNGQDTVMGLVVSDWILVLDRDASVSSTSDAVPAQDILDNSPALQNTSAISKEQIVYAFNRNSAWNWFKVFIYIYEKAFSPL